MFWYCSVGSRVFLHQVPLDCLGKTALQDLMDIPDRACRNMIVPFLSFPVGISHGRRYQELFIITLQKPWIDFGQSYLADHGQDIVIDLCIVRLIGGQGPLIPAIKLDILF